ncbi:TPA: hypothetical protein ACWYGT_004999 [Citrobacter braakii]
MKLESKNIKFVIEKLADIEHGRWSRWQKYLHEQCVKNDDGSLTIPHELVSRWEKQMTTPYSELTDEEKQSDRDLVEKDLDKLHRILRDL